MLFALLLMSLNTHASDHPFPVYYDNKEGAQIASCIRAEITQAPFAELSAYQPGKPWTCLNVMYLWDDQGNLALLVDRDRTKDPHFLFEAFQTHGYKGLKETKSLGQPKVYIPFAHRYQHGIVSMLDTGHPPHKENYFKVAASGFLLLEESARPYPASATEWPSLTQHPRAILRDTPVTPESFLNLATMYSVCYTAEQKNQKLPCFE